MGRSTVLPDLNFWQNAGRFMGAGQERQRLPEHTVCRAGERRGESAGRSKYNEMEIHRTNAEAKAHRIVHQWRPVIDYVYVKEQWMYPAGAFHGAEGGPC